MLGPAFPGAPRCGCSLTLNPSWAKKIPQKSWPEREEPTPGIELQNPRLRGLEGWPTEGAGSGPSRQIGLTAETRVHLGRQGRRERPKRVCWGKQNRYMLPNGTGKVEIKKKK